MPSLLTGISRLPKYNPAEPLTFDQREVFNMIGGKPGNPRKLIWSERVAEGKSVVLCLKMLQWAQKYPGILMWWCRKFYKNLMKNNWPTFLRVVPQDVWKYKIHGGRTPNEIEFPNGSRILICGFSDASSNLGGEPGAVFVEEVSEVDIEVWNYCEGRLRQPGIPEEALIMFGVGNPRGHYPLWKKFCQKEGVDEVERNNYVWYKSKKKFSMKSRLPNRYYEILFAGYPKELQERFLEGSDDTHAGSIYPMFNRELHVQSFTWQKHWIPFIGCDPGRVDPTAAVFCGFDPRTGDVYQIAEYYQANVPTVATHAKVMDEIALEVGWPKSDDAVGKVIDNNATDPGSGNKSIIQMYAENGWYFRPSSGKRASLLPGIELMTQLLMPRPGGKLPRFHIHPRCHHTIEEFQMYEWSVPASASDTMAFREKPREDYNHAMDALRYAVSIMPAVEPANSYRLIGGPYSQMGMGEDDEEETSEASDVRNVGIVCDPKNIEALNKARKAGGWRHLL